MNRRVSLQITELNPFLTCYLCKGYLIDAATITECLHSFCKSCIVRYIKKNESCPICNLEIIKDKLFMFLKKDGNLQYIVYKLVPGLFKSEMKRRRMFYATNPKALKSKYRKKIELLDKEALGEMNDDFFAVEENDNISISIEYNETGLNEICESKRLVELDPANPKRYLECSSSLPIRLLKQFITIKLNNQTEYRNIDVMYDDKPLQDDLTLMDVAYIYAWRGRLAPMRLFYRVRNCKENCLIKNEEVKDNKDNNKVVDGGATKIKTEAVEHQPSGELKDESMDVCDLDLNLQSSSNKQLTSSPKIEQHKQQPFKFEPIIAATTSIPTTTTTTTSTTATNCFAKQPTVVPNNQSTALLNPKDASATNTPLTATLPIVPKVISNENKSFITTPTPSTTATTIGNETAKSSTQVEMKPDPLNEAEKKLIMQNNLLKKFKPKATNEPRESQLQQQQQQTETKAKTKQPAGTNTNTNQKKKVKNTEIKNCENNNDFMKKMMNQQAQLLNNQIKVEKNCTPEGMNVNNTNTPQITAQQEQQIKYAAAAAAAAAAVAAATANVPQNSFQFQQLAANFPCIPILNHLMYAQKMSLAAAAEKFQKQQQHQQHQPQFPPQLNLNNKQIFNETQNFYNFAHNYPIAASTPTPMNDNNSQLVNQLNFAASLAAAATHERLTSTSASTTRTTTPHNFDYLNTNAASTNSNSNNLNLDLYNHPQQASGSPKLNDISSLKETQMRIMESCNLVND